MELYKDILAAPHTLIAGATKSGKSNVMNGILRELMMNYTPEQKSFYLIDPKIVELSPYKNTEFCLGYTSDYEEAAEMLDKIQADIKERYKAMEAAGVRETTKGHVYVFIDELADLFTSTIGNQIKVKVHRITAIGRAAGYHVIMASQAPNRKILDPNVLLNTTNRLALHCVQGIESRQIINQTGAEKLPQHGKGLYLSPEGLTGVDVPLTPDNTELIRKWERKAIAPTYTPPAPSTYKYTYRTYERPTYKKDKTSIIDTIKIACVILGILFLWSIM